MRRAIALRGAVAYGCVAWNSTGGSGIHPSSGSIGGRAEQPKKGGTLAFAVVAEPPNYDCHANISFAFVHPVAPHYSTLLKFDGANYPEDHRRPGQELDGVARRPHLHLQAARGRQVPRRLAR